MTPPDPSSAPALLLVGHGSRDERGAEDFRRLVARLGERHPELAVGGGLVDVSTPSVADAVGGLVDRGARNVVAVPLTLAPSGPVRDAVRTALGAARERHPGTVLRCSRPVGTHPGLLSVLEERIDAVLGGRRAPQDRARTTVLLVGRGSTDPDANAEVHRVARMLWEGRGLAGVETGFVSMAAPDVPAGLDRCRMLGARRIVVLPHLLFPGALPDRMVAQARGWADVHPEVAVHCADVLGDTDELAELVLARYREGRHGGPRAHCDACLEPVRLPEPAEPVGAGAAHHGVPSAAG